jgi:hypothetical protein
VSILCNLPTGRAQRSEARTGAKRLVFCPPWFAALCHCFKTVSFLKALKTPIKNHQKNPEEPYLLTMSTIANARCLKQVRRVITPVLNQDGCCFDSLQKKLPIAPKKEQMVVRKLRKNLCV